MVAPLDDIDALLAEPVRRVAQRQTPIPTMAAAARQAQATHPDLVRADIGQIVGVVPELEVLYGPPVGMEPLREAVAELYQRAFGIQGLTARNVTMCTGAAEAVAVLMHCFARGKRVGLPRGGWSNYRNSIDMAGGEAVTIDFFDDAGKLDLPSIERSIETEQLAVVLANFPCNPTGAVLSTDEGRALVELAVARNVIVIADEVYARLRYDDMPAQSLLAHGPGHVVSVGSASKEYLLPGARVGYVVSARDDLTNRVLRKVVRASSASPNVLGQQRLLGLLRDDLADMRAGRPAALISRIAEEMKRRRDVLLSLLERHQMTAVGRSGHVPAGTIFLMASLPPWWDGDDVSFAERALELGCFSCIPGSAFGLPGAIRLSYGATAAADLDRLDGQLRRMHASLVSRT